MQGHRGMGGPTTDEPSGANRDLGAGRGRQRGGRTDAGTAAGAVMRRGAHRRGAAAGGLWVWAPSMWTVICAGKGCDREVLQR